MVRAMFTSRDAALASAWAFVLGARLARRPPAVPSLDRPRRARDRPTLTTDARVPLAPRGERAARSELARDRRTPPVPAPSP